MNTLVKTIFSVVAAAVLMASLSSCGKSDAGTLSENAKDEQVISVRVETLETRDFSETLRITGTVAAYDDVTVPAEEGGRLVAWEAPRGARIAKGQVIARLDDALLRAAWEAANAQYQLAEITARKQEKVYQEQGISEWQNKSFQYQRDAARAQADLAKARLDKTLIKSPVNGVLDLRIVDAGEMVGPGAPVARIVDNTRLKVMAGVPERYAGDFRIGDHVSFTVDAFPGESFAGKITFVGASVSKDSRTIPIEVALLGRETRLKPDMIASLSIALASRKNVIAVREDYLQLVDKDRFVAYVANGDRAEERVVKLDGSNDGYVLVREGLNPGDRLITVGYQNIGDGQKISVQK